jgi:hypothetical protein
MHQIDNVACQQLGLEFEYFQIPYFGFLIYILLFQMF